MKKKWTSQEKNEISQMLLSGLSPNEIAKKVKRTAKSVRVMLYRMGLKFEDYKQPKQIKICECCGKEILNSGIKYCSKSCAAKINNKIYIKRECLINEKPNNSGNSVLAERPCLNCGKITKRKASSKYCCFPCDQEYRRKERENKVLENTGLLPSNVYRRFLIRKYGAKCMECGWDKINKKSNLCPIELEHIDGDHKNNKLENLKLLCPNCHSLTPTYKSLNRGNGRANRLKRYKDGKSY